MKSLHHIKSIKSVGSTNEKARLLEQALQCPESPFLPKLFDIGLNYKINTYITKFNPINIPHLEETDMGKIIPVMEGIHSKLLDGYRYSREEWNGIQIYLASWSTAEDYKILESILIKDFTVGMAVKSYNKVAGKVGLPQIPFYDTMRVSSINDARIDYSKGAYVGIKKDGANATVERNATVMSRNGQIIMLSHLEEILHETSQRVILFGELVSTTRQSSSGLVNSAIKLGYQSKLPLHELALHVFDAMPIEEYESRQFVTPFKDRIKLAEKTVSEISHPMVQFVEQRIVYSKEEALEIYAEAIHLGEEGIIINDADAVFEIDRSKFRARVKAEETADVRIIAVTPHNKKPNLVGSVTVISEDGVMTDVGSGLTEEMMKEFHINPPIGKIMEIKYNMIIPNQSQDGYTFFLPTVGKNKVRTDKDEADCVLKNLPVLTKK